MDNGEMCYHRFLSGDKAAFDGVWKAYRDNLVFFIERFVHNEAEAEDIAIDVFLNLYVHPHRYRTGTSLKGYLFMLGRCRAIDRIRHGKVLELVTDTEAVEADGESAEDIVLKNERAHRLNTALLKLPADMQTAVHLVFFEELSYEDTARVMKKNRKQVDNLLYRAKAQLRQDLGKEWKL